MWSFFIVSIAVVGVATAAGLLYFPSKSTGLGVRLDVGLAWFSALLALVLTPTDVATALLGNSPSALATWWIAAYWTGFIIQILLLPIHMQFVVSGEFTILDRLIASLRYNLLYYGVLLGITAFSIVFLLFSGRLEYENVVGFCIAFSNAYGLIGAIFLMGFGLVAIPKQLWRSADLEAERRRICHVAGVQAERAADSHRRLSYMVKLTQKTDIMFPRHDASRPFMDIVLNLANSATGRFSRNNMSSQQLLDDEAEAEDFFDREDLARLRGRLKKAIKDDERERALYEEAVHQYLHLEQIQDMTDSYSGGLNSSSYGSSSNSSNSIQQRMERYWHCTARFYVFRALGVITAIASVLIILAEATISGALPNASVASYILHAIAAAAHLDDDSNNNNSQFILELLCFIFLAYQCAAAYYAIYKLGSFAFYRMVPRHTDAYSLCYSGLFMCRFSTPLAFNFIVAIALPITSSSSFAVDVTKTQFYKQFGELMMQQPLIGLSFTTFAPALLVPYVLLLASGLFDRLLGIVFQKSGANLQFEDDWETATKYAAMGKRLLRMESENVKRGLDIGLPIETPDAIAGPSLSMWGGSGGGGDDNKHTLPSNTTPSNTSNTWWNKTLKAVGLGSNDTEDDDIPSGRSRRATPSSSSGAVRNSEAEAARTRLSRTLYNSHGGRQQQQEQQGDGADAQSQLLGNNNNTDSGGGNRGDIFGQMQQDDWWSWKKKYGPGGS